jgi:hypothetical protein
MITATITVSDLSNFPPTLSVANAQPKPCQIYLIQATETTNTTTLLTATITDMTTNTTTTVNETLLFPTSCFQLQSFQLLMEITLDMFTVSIATRRLLPHTTTNHLTT